MVVSKLLSDETCSSLWVWTCPSQTHKPAVSFFSLDEAESFYLGTFYMYTVAAVQA